MKHRPLPPLEELKEFLDYNPDTGIITWKKAKQGIRVGQVGGAINSDDRKTRMQIYFNCICYMLHRVAYYIYHGVDPLEKQIDHIDGNPLNNKIDNLRLATNEENQRNRSISKNNTSGTTGVTWIKECQKWRAHIKNINLGHFINKEDAIQTRIEAEKKYFGEFRRDSQIDCDFPK